MTDVLRGVWPAATLPFTESHAVDTQAFADHCRWPVDSGCPAVMLLPPTSHSPTHDEVVAHS